MTPEQRKKFIRLIDEHADDVERDAMAESRSALLDAIEDYATEKGTMMVAHYASHPTALRVRRRPAEEFMNWYPYHTRLYIRGEVAADKTTLRRLRDELFEQLSRFFEVHEAER